MGGKEGKGVREQSHWKILTIFHSVETMTGGQFPPDASHDRQVNKGWLPPPSSLLPSLKVHKNKNFFSSDLEFCTISLFVMLKYITVL